MNFHQLLHKNRISFDVCQFIVSAHSQIVRDNRAKDAFFLVFYLVLSDKYTIFAAPLW